MMAALKRRFRALANGGISPLEATRREEAVRLDAPARELPPSLIAERLAGNVIPIADPKVLSGAPETAGVASAEATVLATEAGLGPQPALPCASNQKPVVTITIDGLHRSGKSVIAHIIRTALAAEGVRSTTSSTGVCRLSW